MTVRIKKGYGFFPSQATSHLMEIARQDPAYREDTSDSEWNRLDFTPTVAGPTTTFLGLLMPPHARGIHILPVDTTASLPGNIPIKNKAGATYVPTGAGDPLRDQIVIMYDVTSCNNQGYCVLPMRRQDSRISGNHRPRCSITSFLTPWICAWASRGASPAQWPTRTSCGASQARDCAA